MMTFTLTTLLALLYGAMLMNLTLIFFIAIMKLRDMKDAGQITGVLKWFGHFNLVIGLILDVLVNIFPATFVFFELPRLRDKEWLTTARLSRIIKTGDVTWRYGLAMWFCKELLSKFDSTKRHCGE